MTKSPATPPAPRLWDYKPWWCQPWSILLTGTLLVAGVWWLTRSLWLTLPVSGAIALWWLVFLILVPRQFRQAQESPPT
ncbi:MAG: hypothetical protein HC910_06980 [Spirulinaceae cyanobacterium SM2_1_0]|nr:hypothetical protein [Spirulinaceae cyanobacterium SM2_1_0]